MSLQLKGKRKKTSDGNVKQRRQRQLELLDLPEFKPIESTTLSVETGLQKENSAETYQEDKNATIQNAIENNKDEYKVGIEMGQLKSNSKIEKETLDLKTLLPSEKEGFNGDLQKVSTIGTHDFKGDVIPITKQQLSNEKLMDQSFSYGPLNNAFWERLRKEVTKVMKENLTEISFEAAPAPESERVKNKKKPVYVSSGPGMIRF